MTTLIITANFVALIIGIISLVVSYRLVRTYHLPYLNNYFYFVLCSVVSGFFDWIAFNWIKVWVPAITPHSLDSIYHVFWGLIGFPCAVFAVYFLFNTLSEMAGFTIKKIVRRAIIAVCISFVVLSFVRVMIFADEYRTFIGFFLSLTYIIFLTFLQLAFLLYIFITSREIKNSHGIFLKKFAAVLGLSFLFWYLIMYFGLLFRMGAWNHVVILGFYMALLVPTLFLHYLQKKSSNTQVFEEVPVEKFDLFFEEEDFTEREREIIILLYKGKSNKAIEEELFISLQTVKNYVSKIYKKLNIKNRLELVNFLRNKTS